MYLYDIYMYVGLYVYLHLTANNIHMYVCMLWKLVCSFKKKKALINNNNPNTFQIT